MISFDGQGRDTVVVELGDEAVLIGRGAECEIRIAHETLARRHARIIYRDGCRWIEDLGSASGTLVNMQQTRGPTRLAHCDRIRCGVIEFLYCER